MSYASYIHSVDFTSVASATCPIYPPKLLHENPEELESTSQKYGDEIMVLHGIR